MKVLLKSLATVAILMAMNLGGCSAAPLILGVGATADSIARRSNLEESMRTEQSERGIPLDTRLRDRCARWALGRFTLETYPMSKVRVAISDLAINHRASNADSDFAYTQVVRTCTQPDPGMDYTKINLSCSDDPECPQKLRFATEYEQVLKIESEQEARDKLNLLLSR